MNLPKEEERCSDGRRGAAGDGGLCQAVRIPLGAGSGRCARQGERRWGEQRWRERAPSIGSPVSGVRKIWLRSDIRPISFKLPPTTKRLTRKTRPPTRPTHTRSALRAKAVHPPQEETSRGIGFRKLVQALNSGYPVPLRTSPELPVMGLAEYPGRFAPFPLSGGLEPAAGGLKQSPPAGTRPQNGSN